METFLQWTSTQLDLLWVSGELDIFLLTLTPWLSRCSQLRMTQRMTQWDWVSTFSASADGSQLSINQPSNLSALQNGITEVLSTQSVLDIRQDDASSEMTNKNILYILESSTLSFSFCSKNEKGRGTAKRPLNLATYILRAQIKVATTSMANHETSLASKHSS